MRYKLMLICIFCYFILAGMAEAQTSNNYTLTWNVIGGGGGSSNSANYKFNSTIGQATIGFSTSTNYSMGSGYWYGIGLASTILPAIKFINGTTMDGITKELLTGVLVSTIEATAISNESGFYSMAVTSGIYNLTATLEPIYYSNTSISVSTVENAVVVQNIELLKKPTGNITGSVST